MSRELVIGTVQFGLAYGVNGSGRAVDAAEAHAVLKAGHDAGVRRLDTAPGYGDAEERLADLAGRLDFSITSKIPALPTGIDGAAVRDFVATSIETSRRRLGERLTALLFHRGADLDGPHGERLFDAAQDLCRAAGLQLGVSSYEPDAVGRLASRYPFTLAQVPGSAFDQRVSRAALGGIAVDIRSIFLQGLLSGPREAMARRLPAAAEALVRWHDWCARQGLDPVAAAVAVARGLRPGAGFVVGVETCEQLHQILSAWATTASVTAAELAVDDPAVIRPDLWTLAP